MNRFPRTVARPVAPIALGVLLLGSTVAAQEATSIPRTGKSPYQVDQADPSKAPKVYTIPIKGQLGTDVNLAAYKAVFEDVQEKKPDLIVFIMDCADVNDVDYITDDDPEERGMYDRYDMRPLVLSFKEEFKNIPQVIWVQDAVGYSSVLPFAWRDMFLGSKARILGAHMFALNAQHPDFEVQRKFLAAAVAMAAGFMEAGGYDARVLGEAMLRPENKLSVTWEGRNLVWSPNENGTYVVDASDRAPASFNAKTAEDLMLSKGTVDDIDDLIFLLGYREWDRSLVDGKQDGVRIMEDYTKRWRDAYEKSLESWATYKREANWAGGDPDETVAHLGKARRSLQEILEAMQRYPAVEARWQSRRRGERLNQIDVESLLRELREQIVAAENAKKNRRGGAGGRGGMGGSGGRGLGR